jgi:hypothetical protein
MRAIENSYPYVTVESSNGLYFFSPTDFKKIIDKTQKDNNSISVPKKSTSIAVYHTVQFGNLSDLVLFCHENLGHINR